MKLKMLIALFAGSLVATSAMASDAAPKNKKDVKRMICRTDDEIGSLVHKKKICLTAEQWSDVSHQSGIQMEKTQQLGNTSRGN